MLLMASRVNFHPLYSGICYSSRSYSYKSQTLAFGSSQLPCESLLKTKKRSRVSILQNRKLNSRIYAAQSNFFRVLQTVYKVGKDGVEAGTSLVPASIPRPIARISVAVVGATVALFLLKSFLSTAFFVLMFLSILVKNVADVLISMKQVTMGLIYSAFIALNNDEGPTGGGGGGGGTTVNSTEEKSLEEARRIMEKYK
ncbi:hypothetical protein OSB04_000990 [Centaurea solstitialis]|uniref:Uncharacterized protein n=1 Tax=Centaurea solstitialis TaxID=347529 RepID=A0AA38WU67_9ASTR|nr:hypothetical protein OSB04_000990 [Centaurea solstitialis]